MVITQIEKDSKEMVNSLGPLNRDRSLSNSMNWATRIKEKVHDTFSLPITTLRQQDVETADSIKTALRVLKRKVPEEEEKNAVEAGKFVTDALSKIAKEDGIFYRQRVPAGGSLDFYRRSRNPKDVSIIGDIWVAPQVTLKEAAPLSNGRVERFIGKMKDSGFRDIEETKLKGSDITAINNMKSDWKQITFTVTLTEGEKWTFKDTKAQDR